MLRSTLHRIRFQFRLRTLLLLLTIVSVWLALDPKLVRDRRAALADPRLASSAINMPGVSVSWLRSMQGDYAIRELVLFDYDPQKLTRLKSLFPEAEVRHACSLEFMAEMFPEVYGVTVTP